MKKSIVALLLLFLHIDNYSQNTNSCEIKLITEKKQPTETSFFIKLGDNVINSENGTIFINDSLFSIYKEYKITLEIENKVLFDKLYKQLPIINTPTKLEDACFEYILKRKF